MARKANSRQLTPETLDLVAGRFKVLGDPTRLRLIMALEAGEKNVTELVRTAGTTQANVSRHLLTLTDARILTRRRSGLKVLYAISDRSILALYRQVLGTLEKQSLQQASLFARTPVARG